MANDITEAPTTDVVAVDDEFTLTMPESLLKNVMGYAVGFAATAITHRVMDRIIINIRARRG